MRTFGLTVYETVTAATREAALGFVERVLPPGLAVDITFDDSEVTDQHCVECWCLTEEDSQRCSECESTTTDGVPVDDGALIEAAAPAAHTEE